jgi:hypothetical protein
MTSSEPLLLLIRINAPETDDREALYEKARKWWKAALAQVERATRVLAIIDGQVVEVYAPEQWTYGPPNTDDADRVGFTGPIAADRDTWVGRDLKHLFKKGAANPVRYLPASALEALATASANAAGSGRDLALLLRLNQTWFEGISAEQLYEVTRAWWVMSAANAERVDRVLAVAGGVVREAYEPNEWLPSPVAGLENRIGFEGQVAEDRETYVGRDVAHLFVHGSANPVRYLPLEALLADAPADVVPSETTPTPDIVEPGLLERVLPLIDAFEHDLVWAQSKAAQELFHSNTLAWLLQNHPRACLPILELLGGSRYDSVRTVKVWREKGNLDLVIDPVDNWPKIVVENKLYSIPYPSQLTKYLPKKLPWSDAHGAEGAEDTRYVLLSLMWPSFPLPRRWELVTYDELADALDIIDERSLGSAADLFVRYRALVHRLVALSEAVSPAQSLDETFSVAETVKKLPGGGLDGAIAKLRFSGLAEVVQAGFTETKEFVLDGKKGGILSYWRRISPDRWVGWQFEGNQLRLQVLLKDENLQGKRFEVTRAQIVEAEYLDFFDHTGLVPIVGSDLNPNEYQPGHWLKFNPNFVYRHRPVKKSISTAKLAAGLVHLTRHVDAYADRLATH